MANTDHDTQLRALRALAGEPVIQDGDRMVLTIPVTVVTASNLRNGQVIVELPGGPTYVHYWHLTHLPPEETSHG